MPRKSITLSDANGSGNEAGLVVADIPSYTPERASSTDTKYFIYKLVSSKKRGKVYIDGIDDVINPNTGKLDRMRLLRGVPTIWQSEQKDLEKGFVERNRRSLVFDGDAKKKIMRVPDWDSTMLEFIKYTRHCIDNPNRRTGSKHEFFEWNPQRQQQEALKRRMKKIDAIQAAAVMPADKMKKHALYLGVSFVDELGMPKTDDGLRSDYLLKAEENPEKFMDSVDKKEVTISYLVKRAISDAKIDLGRKPNEAYWSAGGGYIARIPRDRKAAEYLLEFAMTNSEEGQSFLAQLEQVVK